MDGYDGGITSPANSRSKPNNLNKPNKLPARTGWGETRASDMQLPEEERQKLMRRVGSGELTVDQAMAIFNQVETGIKGAGGGPPPPAADPGLPAPPSPAHPSRGRGGGSGRWKKAEVTEVLGFDGPTHTRVAKAPRPKQHAAAGIAEPPTRGTAGTNAGWMSAPGVVDGLLPGGTDSTPGVRSALPGPPGQSAATPPGIISAHLSLRTTRAGDSKRSREAGPSATSSVSGSPSTPAGQPFNRMGIPRQTPSAAGYRSAPDVSTPGGSRSRGGISRTVDRAVTRHSAPRPTPTTPVIQHPPTVSGPCINMSPVVNIAVRAQGCAVVGDVHAMPMYISNPAVQDAPEKCGHTRQRVHFHNQRVSLPRRGAAQDDVPMEFAANARGELDSLDAIVASSKVLQMVNGRIEMAPHGVFVFGGNAVGNGVADITVANSLLVLKLRYPDRVSHHCYSASTAHAPCPKRPRPVLT